MKRKLERKSRATVNLVARDFPLQMFKKDPRNEFLSPFITLKKSFYTPNRFRIKEVPNDVIEGSLYTPLEKRLRRRLEPKCAPQLFLGSLLGMRRSMRRSAIVHYFPGPQ